jgi:hypothetical protein
MLAYLQLSVCFIDAVGSEIITKLSGESRIAQEMLSSPHHPDLLWGQDSLMLSGYQSLFPQGSSSWIMKLLTHLNQVPPLLHIYCHVC